MKRDEIAKWYMKKPIPVQAIQWTGDNFAQIEEFAGSGYVWVEDGYLFVASHDCTFKTQSKTGDYIVRGAMVISISAKSQVLKQLMKRHSQLMANQKLMVETNGEMN